jgi:hypothetical protein
MSEIIALLTPTRLPRLKAGVADLPLSGEGIVSAPRIGPAHPPIAVNIFCMCVLSWTAMTTISSKPADL